MLDVSKANTFITHSYLFVCLLLYYKSQRMGIFFILKQKFLPLKQAILHKKFKKVVAFLNRKVNKEIEKFFVKNLDQAFMFQLDF
ncbi:hypothetical protein B7719_08900 [Streptococcus oralis subsp. oralis]|nr:hypothetical protein B7719_08900 [Streptococcus oralis subsp. oralis]